MWEGRSRYLCLSLYSDIGFFPLSHCKGCKRGKKTTQTHQLCTYWLHTVITAIALCKQFDNSPRRTWQKKTCYILHTIMLDMTQI